MQWISLQEIGPHKHLKREKDYFHNSAEIIQLIDKGNVQIWVFREIVGNSWVGSYCR